MDFGDYDAGVKETEYKQSSWCYFKKECKDIIKQPKQEQNLENVLQLDHVMSSINSFF